MNKWERIMKSSEDKEAVHDRLAQVFEGKIIIHPTPFCGLVGENLSHITSSDGFEDWPELVHDEEGEGHGHSHSHAHGH